MHLGNLSLAIEGDMVWFVVIKHTPFNWQVSTMCLDTQWTLLGDT